MSKVFFVFGLYAAMLVGYVLNVVKFIQSDFKPSYKREIIYGIGVISGLGIIIGWMDIEDVKE